jgi:dTDP-D-glucose 4,6-dehydratase
VEKHKLIKKEYNYSHMKISTEKWVHTVFQNIRIQVVLQLMRQWSKDKSVNMLVDHLSSKQINQVQIYK